MVARLYPIMPPRPALAVSLYVSGRRCVVVGDGPMAAERAGRLTAAGADVVLCSRSEYRADLCRGAFMVFCCDAPLGPAVSRDARAAGALVYVLDMPAISDLAMPALVKRGPLQIAVSTDAQSPALARRLREELERLLAASGIELDAFIDELARLREETLPPARRDALYELATRLSIEGRVKIRRP
jgi:precorrin-2 dehydrogenase / sirohydrochlorin ferrochelatase